jgi:hypothetical protein
MFKFKSIVASALIAIFSALPAQAEWAVVERQGQNNAFVMSINQAVETPQNNKTYAYIEYGVIAKIVIWNANSNNSYITQYVPASLLPFYDFKDVTFLAEVPQSLKVNYTSATGEIGAEAINQGDIVAVVPTLDSNPLSNQDVVIPVTTQVVSTSVNSDYSTSITLAPPVVNNHNQTVEVQVVANGISFTSVATNNTSTPITINSLPSNEYVTVQTVFRDTTTGQTVINQEVPIITANANVPVLVNSRDSVQDKAIISIPTSQAIINGDSKSAIISFDAITNFDSSKTMASIMVVGPNGSTTYIGIDGNGGTVNVSDLSSALNYTVKMVIRDINSGEETVISGNSV